MKKCLDAQYSEELPVILNPLVITICKDLQSYFPEF